MSVATRIAGTVEKDWKRLTSQLRYRAFPEPIQPVIVNSKYADWFEREGIPHTVAEVEDVQ